jgi:hypothetical protein
MIVEDFLNNLRTICGLDIYLTIKDTDILTVKEAIQEGLKPEQMAAQQPTVNDALKGLSAKDNMDMMRIMRDFSKGRLAEPLARTRLAAYGVDEETINTLLSAE